MVAPDRARGLRLAVAHLPDALRIHSLLEYRRPSCLRIPACRLRRSEIRNRRKHRHFKACPALPCPLHRAKANQQAMLWIALCSWGAEALDGQGVPAS